jgi:hypothetical protein
MNTSGAIMKVAANKTAPALSNLESGFRRMFRTVCAELRRGIELAGEKYMNGMVPPL